MKCTAPSCRNGEAECPGQCLKLTKGTWIHMEVAGHPPTDVWQKFTTPAGGWRAYNQNHVGHIIKLQNGDFKEVGRCPICKGTTRVKCTVCNGTGEVVCNICDGKKVVPASWTAFDNPKMKSQPDHFRLKDGTVLVGRQVVIMGSHTTIRTAKGDVEVNTADIVPEGKESAGSK